MEEERLDELSQQLKSLPRDEQIPQGMGAEIVGILMTAEVHLQKRAASLLGQLEGRAALAVEALSCALSAQKDDATRCEIIGALGKIGAAASTAIPELLRLLSTEDTPDRVRWSAAAALGGIGPDSYEATEALAALLLKEAQLYSLSWIKSSAALAGLFGIGAAALPSLCQSWRERDEPTEKLALLLACCAIAAHSKALDPETIKLLQQSATVETNSEARRLAVQALGDAGDEGSLQVVRSALNDEDQVVAAQAARSLSRLGQKGLQATALLLRERAVPLRADLLRGLREVASDPESTTSQLKWFLEQSSSPELVAENPNATSSMLAALAKNQSITATTKMLIAAHPQTPTETLKRLASIPELMAVVAANPSAPRDVLRDLASRRAVAIRRAIAQNPSAPLAALRKVAESSQDLQVLVAQNPSAPPSLLQDLADNISVELRGAVARHPRAPRALLEKLSQAPLAGVKDGVARNPNATVSVLSRLARDRGLAVRAAVASNNKAPSSLLEELSKDDIVVQRALAQNSGTPIAVLRALTKNPMTRRAARRTLTMRNEK